MIPIDALTRFFEEAIPFNRVLGIQVDEVGSGRCILRVQGREEFTGNPRLPAMHGGVISSLADSAGGLAVFSQLELSQNCSTVDLRVDYLRPAVPTEALICESRVVRAGNRVVVTDSTLRQGERIVSTARAVYNVVAHAIDESLE